MNKFIDRLFQIIDKHGLVRRAVLGVTLWMTWKAYVWASLFAIESARNGMEVATIIAAVLAPITVLQGHAFQAYIGSRES